MLLSYRARPRRRKEDTTLGRALPTNRPPLRLGAEPVLPDQQHLIWNPERGFQTSCQRPPASKARLRPTVETLPERAGAGGAVQRSASGKSGEGALVCVTQSWCAARVIAT